MELEIPHALPHTQRLRRAQRDAVRHAIPKGVANDLLLSRDGVPRAGNGEDGVSDEEMGLPVEAERAREVATAEDGSDTGEDGGVEGCEGLDVRRSRGSRDEPVAIRCAYVNRGVGKGRAPIGVGGVVVWMRYGNSGEAAERFDLVDRRLVEEGNHIPQDIAMGRLDQHGALADGEIGIGPDAPDGWVDGVAFPEVAVAGLFEFRHGGEGLA